MEMMLEHEEWINKAVELAKAKRYDDARALAVRVIREDGRNTKALWIVASVTKSLNERRNALKALLRLQPDNQHARRMLQDIEQEYSANINANARSSTAVRSIKPAFQPALLYAAVAITALVLIATVFIASTIH